MAKNKVQFQAGYSIYELMEDWAQKKMQAGRYSIGAIQTDLYVGSAGISHIAS